MAIRLDKYTEINKKQEIYSDFLTNLNVHPDTQQLLRITNEDAVKRSIRNLLLTSEYERLFQPDVYSNIRKILFENITAQTTEQLKTYVREVIENHEPRCKLVMVDAEASEYEQAYRVTVVYYTINNPAPQNLTVTLYRIR